MKKAVITLILSAVCAAGLFADAPRNDITPLERVVMISNPEAFPEYLVLAYVTGPRLKGLRPFNIYEIAAGRPIENFDLSNTVSVIAVKRATVKSLGLDAIDFSQLVKTNRIVPARIVQPMQTGTFEEPPPPYREEIVYAITALCDDSVYLQPAEKTLNYTDGRVIVKTYIDHPSPRRFTRPAQAASVSAGDYLADGEFPDRYHPARAFDGVPATGWSEGASGSGVGETISITFAGPVTVDRITVIPGWFDARYFRKNNRVESLEVRLDGRAVAATFSDTMTAQNVPLPGLGKVPLTFTSATFTITGVYRGTEWDDTPIAEITFYANGEPILVDLSGIELIDSCYGKYR
ncbi:MAG: hypothetical protein JXD23_14380 [Spirochaetales bacterium]|nr:hypothetical protein [Spirochaetales bacterium]